MQHEVGSISASDGQNHIRYSLLVLLPASHASATKHMLTLSSMTDHILQHSTHMLV